MVFQFVPGTGKSYGDAEDAGTSRIGRSIGTGFDHIFKFTRIAKILQKHREWGANLPPPPRCSRVNGYGRHLGFSAEGDVSVFDDITVEKPVPENRGRRRPRIRVSSW